MTLVDTSVWVEHLRNGEPDLVRRLNAGDVLGHPLVIGELAMGNLHRRDAVLEGLRALPRSVVADDDEVLSFVARHRLHGEGIGYVDAHLLAAVQLTPFAVLWTKDPRLARIALQMGLDGAPASI
jgi:predicted nucleic acid-binding protein